MQSLNIGFTKNTGDKIHKVCSVVAISSDFGTGQYDFLVTCGDSGFYLADNQLYRKADFLSPDKWYDRAPKLPGVDPGVEKEIEKIERAQMVELPVPQRRNFDEVELGLTEEMARRETQRCLQCGLICYRGYREKAS